MTVLIFIIVLSILVFVHELGHFVMAKKAGMRVEEFGFGFPPRIFSIKRGETKYSLNLIPFGGFVKILGEDGEERDNPRSFSSKGLLSRTGVIIAGVAMNFLLAVFLLIIVNGVGLRIGVEDKDALATARDIKIQVVEVVSGSPAEKAGIKTLDQIVSLNYQTQSVAATDVATVQQFVNQHKGQEIAIDISNGSQTREVKITPRDNPPANQGALGIAMARTGLISYPWPIAFIKGFEYSANIFVATLLGYFTIIRNILTHGTPGVEVTGPVGIATLTGQAAHSGIIYLMQFMALISVNLAVLNVIPFPALDGGRLLFLALEKIKGKPVSRKLEGVVNTVGFALLLTLMIYITTKDIIKFL